ncbi:ral guanine nucleotide dissociation stimulator-like 2 isoform X2 [Ambystoma mexicanum]|uniref:ral guanine nucleotide dissociation stimulator-like 2 isoform X2 n=1 Tax=Ambystoma mexicanum TaxID=8296 RepID=UPI0037E85A2F
MSTFVRLGSCLYPEAASDLSRSTWYCWPVKAPVYQVEEAAEGAIYSVAVRHAHGHSGTSPVQAGQTVESEAIGDSPETPKVRVLKAGTLQRLVHHLLEAFTMGDTTYVPAFLATFRAFTTVETVLTLLLDRLQTLEATRSVKSRGRESAESTLELHTAASTVFCSWMECYPEDFRGALDPALLDRFSAYITREFGEGSGPGRRRDSLLQMLEKLRTANREAEEPSISEMPESGNTSPGEVLDILILLADHVAAQLTILDADLFQRVVPYHCLGSIWSARDKKGKEPRCPSVRATVCQFNKLTNAVISSCLSNTQLRPQQRARVLEKWIKVAEECRALKNFSSLYAIISALQSNPVHRLKRTWDETSREAVRSYQELSEVFSEKDNYSHSRELLFKSQEETSRPAHLELHPRKQQKRPKEQRSVGVVPYLGTFLKDLVMLDTAVKDLLENGYLNFDKRRKEFEILAQIRLLQSISKNYLLEKDPTFVRWFDSVQPLSEADSYRLSCEIEPLQEPSNPRPLKPTLVITHCTDLLSSVATPFGPGTCSWERPSTPKGHSDCPFEYSMQVEHQLRPDTLTLTRLTKHMKSTSVSSLDTVGVAPPGPVLPTPLPATLSLPASAFVKSHRRSASCGSAFLSPSASSTQSNDENSECRIIRVQMALENGNLYKSILVTSQDKTPAVIDKVLEKHNQDRLGAANYQLVQLLPDEKELSIPNTANVFYAMNASSRDFLLRRKGQLAPSQAPPRHRTELSATFPKIKSKGMRIARALF